MKYIIIVVLFTFISNRTFCQNITYNDDSIGNLITEGYLKIGDSSGLPLSVAKFSPQIRRYLLFKQLDIDNYYFSYKEIKFDLDTMHIPLFHLDGFIKRKELEKENKEMNKNRKESEGILVKEINGNMSSKDGHLEINIRDGKIIRFSIWN